MCISLYTYIFFFFFNRQLQQLLTDEKELNSLLSSWNRKNRMLINVLKKFKEKQYSELSEACKDLSGGSQKQSRSVGSKSSDSRYE